MIQSHQLDILSELIYILLELVIIKVICTILYDGSFVDAEMAEASEKLKISNSSHEEQVHEANKIMIFIYSF